MTAALGGGSGNDGHGSWLVFCLLSRDGEDSLRIIRGRVFFSSPNFHALAPSTFHPRKWTAASESTSCVVEGYAVASTNRLI